MNSTKSLLYIFTICFLTLSCKSKKGIVTKKKDAKTVKVTTPNTSKSEQTDSKTSQVSSAKSSTQRYIDTYSAIAMEEMRRYKIPASITLAQGILESGSGKGRLASEANNHFGIKCHGWKGKKIYHDDDKRQECFRKYEKAKSSYEDHSKFLTTRGRYSNLFKLRQNDYKGWARGLRAAGYATDRKYPEKLISLIERYKLYQFDEHVLGKKNITNTSVAEVTHKVIKGDTLYSLSKRYGVSIESLQELNNLEGNSITLGQLLIIKK